MQRNAQKTPIEEIVIETADGSRVSIKVKSDAEAERVKAKATAQGGKIVTEEIEKLS